MEQDTLLIIYLLFKLKKAHIFLSLCGFLVELNFDFKFLTRIAIMRSSSVELWDQVHWFCGFTIRHTGMMPHFTVFPLGCR